MVSPKLSIAVITYNQERYIEQTVESLISQKHDYPYEIIIGEDCSTDSTREVLSGLQARHPDVVKLLFNETNLGIVGNYFNVMRNCRGEYIMQCAGDDRWLPGKVELQLRFMEAHGDVGMAYSAALRVHEAGHRGKPAEWQGGVTTFDGLIAGGNRIPAASAVFRRDELLRYLRTVKPLEKGWLMEDYPLWLWFALNSKIHYFPQPTVAYRVLEDSASHCRDLRKLEAFQHSTLDIKYFFLSLAERDFDEDDRRDDGLRWDSHNSILAREYHKALENLDAVKSKTSKDKAKILILRSRVLSMVYRAHIIKNSI